MKKVTLFVLAAMAAFAFSACEPQAAPETPAPDTFVLKGASIDATAEGGQQTISFTTSTAWTIENSANWLSFDKVNGEAGDVEVILTIAANDTFEARSAKFTITAGENKSEWTVNQGYIAIFGAEGDINVDAKAQTIAIKVKTNETFTVAIADNAKDWIAEAATKAAPANASAVLSIAANNSVEDRSGVVTLTSASGSEYVYTIKQAASENALADGTAFYVSNVEYPYDSEAGHPTNVAEYILMFGCSKGMVAVTINGEPSDTPLAGIPTGEFEVDATGAHEPGTFSVGADLEVGCCLVTSDEYGLVYNDFVDGLIEITKNGDNDYEISMVFMDEFYNMYEYFYNGGFDEILDFTEDAVAVSTATYYGDYYTHFATGTNKYSINLQIAKPAVKEDVNLYSISFDIWGPKGDAVALPTGTFTFTDESTVEADPNVTYTNGKMQFTAGMLTGGQYNYADYDFETGGYVSVAFTEGTVKITPDASYANYYTAEINMKATASGGYYDDEWNWVETMAETTFNFNKTYEDLYMPVDNQFGGVQEDDAEVAFTGGSLSNDYIGYWYGKPYVEVNSVNGDALWIGWSLLNGFYTVNLPIILPQNTAFAYVKNYSGRYCQIDIVNGTYTYAPGYEPVAGSIGNWKTKSRKALITNTYTGTTSYVNGGSVTFKNGVVTFDLTAATEDGAKTFKYTGSFTSKCSYYQDYTTSASRLAQATWAEAPAE